MTGLLLVALGAVVLWAGAEAFTKNVAGVADRLRLSVAGVAVLFAGAEPEEAVTAVTASLQNRPGLAAGDAIGANVVLLTLALGLAALGRPVASSRRVRAYALAAAAAGVLAVLVLAGGNVGRAEAVGLLLGYTVAGCLAWWRERRPPAVGEIGEVVAAGRARASSRPLLGAGLGLAAMTAGGWLAVRGSGEVIGVAHLGESVVGLTLLALATSAEVLALVVASVRRGIEEVAVAALLGSVVYNATVSLAAGALARPLELSGLLAPLQLAAVLTVVVAAALAGWVGRHRLGRAAGLVLVAGYGGWTWLLVSRSVPGLVR